METSLFSRRCSLHPPGENNFVLSHNTTNIDQRQLCAWLLERLAVNYFDLFESLN